MVPKLVEPIFKFKVIIFIVCIVHGKMKLYI